jgi:hypothetical protein
MPQGYCLNCGKTYQLPNDWVNGVYGLCPTCVAEKLNVFCGECGQEIPIIDVYTDKETKTETNIIVKPHICWMDNLLNKIQTALSYALKQTKDETTKHLIAQEFWNSLNRKGLISNEKVETLIKWTMEKAKPHKNTMEEEHG